MTDGTKSCPYCAEEIQAAAIICKHCGSDLEAKPARKVNAKDHESYWTFTILAILLPIIGVIVGVVYLVRSDPLEKKLGEHTLAFSILWMILWWALLMVL